MTKIVIDLQKLVIAKDGAGQFAINGEGEELLIQLREAREQVETLYHEALAKVYEQAIEYDPKARAIDGHKIRINFSPSGAKYEANQIENLEDKFKKTTITLDTDAIDIYYEAHLELPEGVKVSPERGTSIRLQVKKDANSDDTKSL